MQLSNKREAKIAALYALSGQNIAISGGIEFENETSMKLFNDAIDDLCYSLYKRAEKLERTNK